MGEEKNALPPNAPCYLWQMTELAPEAMRLRELAQLLESQHMGDEALYLPWVADIHGRATLFWIVTEKECMVGGHGE